MKQLIIGQIPNDFYPDTHIPITSSCFIGKEDIYPHFEKLEYISIYSGKEELKYLDEITSAEALVFVNIIAKELYPNEFEKHNFRFWKTIFYPWLGLIIPWIYRKQLLINKLIDKYGDNEIEIELIDKNFDINTKNEIDFIIDGIWNSTVNDWMFSRLIENKLPAKWKVSYTEAVFNRDVNTINKFNKKKSYKRMLLEKINKAFFRSLGIYGFNLLHSVLFHIVFTLKPVLREKEQSNVQASVKSIKWDIDITKLLLHLIPNSLKTIDFSLDKRNYHKGKIINYSNSLYYSLDRKLDTAYAYENGEVVLASQHGGHNYGSAFAFAYGEEIEFNSNYFISWGWKDRRFQIIDLPSPLLSGMVNKHKKSNDKIIFVGTDMTAFQTRFESWPSDFMFIVYRKNKEKLIKKIKYKDNLLYRPYPEKKTSFSDSKYILSKFPQLKMHNGDLHKDMQQCNLLILDHPGTTWNIAMAMNTPTLLFWEREHFPFNKEADSFLDKFKKLGLYFENPIDAAKRLNELNEKYDDLSKWWNQKEIQDLRKKWMYKYARADKNWFWIWVKTLWKLK